MGPARQRSAETTRRTIRIHPILFIELHLNTSTEVTEAGTITAGTAPEATEAGTITAGAASEATEAGTITAGTAPEATEAGTSTAGIAPEATEAGTSTAGTAPEATEAGTTPEAMVITDADIKAMLERTWTTIRACADARNKI
ncbi:uncharacterized protein HRG_04558 [Hirsutella rhossiliensis]|uniref:Uncharacterized protein n=1 Tax=Hirsutella rhossiliensis TaxID=111463 RepID=A0A9P8SJV9_9HYPO|nr:uncharacterized protein HRG_04558 [Hirsutella rhossiliensis]KAH0964130.1 hypothetical protein HRG_04558 [Hirsutella rhossiliensis]